MNKQKALKLEAQEFYFGPNDDFSTRQDNRVCYGTKEELKNQLQGLVSKGEFSSVVKTAHHSYTFIPQKTKDGNEKMPVRVYLSKEDTKGNFSNVGFFDDLIVNCKAINKSKNVNRLVLVTGATALVLAGTIACASFVGRMIEKEYEYDQQRLAPYLEQQEQLQTEEELRKLIQEDQKREAEKQRKEIEAMQSVDSELVSKGTLQ